MGLRESRSACLSLHRARTGRATTFGCHHSNPPGHVVPRFQRAMSALNPRRFAPRLGGSARFIAIVWFSEARRQRADTCTRAKPRHASAATAAGLATFLTAPLAAALRYTDYAGCSRSLRGAKNVETVTEAVAPEESRGREASPRPSNGISPRCSARARPAIGRETTSGQDDGNNRETGQPSCRGVAKPSP